MKRIFMIVISAVIAVLAASCGSVENTAKPDVKKEAEDREPIADNTTYQGTLSNYYNAYEYCDASYQMATFAPSYKKYVMTQYGYADEEKMAEQLQTIIDDNCETYKTSFGDDYEIVFDIKEESDLDENGVKALKSEMEELYGGEFPITEAKEVTVSVIISAGEQAGKSEDIITVGKLENDGWYILK